MCAVFVFFSAHFISQMFFFRILFVVCTDFNQYYNLALLKDVERTSAAFGFGTPNDFLPPINSLKTANTLKQYQSASEPSSVSKKPSSNYYLRLRLYIYGSVFFVCLSLAFANCHYVSILCVCLHFRFFSVEFGEVSLASAKCNLMNGLIHRSQSNDGIVNMLSDTIDTGEQSATK